MDQEMKAEFNKLNKRFDNIDQRFGGIDERLDGIDQRFKGIDPRFDLMDKRFDQADERFDELFEAVGYFSNRTEQRFMDLESKIVNLPDKEYIDNKFAAFARANNLVVRDDSDQSYEA